MPFMKRGGVLERFKTPRHETTENLTSAGKVLALTSKGYVRWNQTRAIFLSKVPRISILFTFVRTFIAVYRCLMVIGRKFSVNNLVGFVCFRWFHLSLILMYVVLIFLVIGSLCFWSAYCLIVCFGLTVSISAVD